MTYSEATAYLTSLEQFGWKLDLARIHRLCNLAGHPERAFRSVLVGGSAGKGSTCAFLAAILQAAGVRTGMAPKPHLITHRERVQVNGAMISEADFAALIGRIQPLVQRTAAEEGPVTVFEVMTLLAFIYFAQSGVERAVVEVGLGGRFDATNVLAPDLSIVTTIHLDHTDRLGTTLGEIAFEKAGIIRPESRVVTGARNMALDVILATAQERRARIWRLGEEIHLSHTRLDGGGVTFDLDVPTARFTDLRATLTGAHQAHNAALAAAAAWWLRDRHPTLDESALRAGLASATLAARLQVLQRRPLVIVDAAHSPDRAEALASALRSLYLGVNGPPGRRVFLVLGCSRGHEPGAVVARLAPLAIEVLATRSAHPGAVPPSEVAAAARAEGTTAEVVEPVAAAVTAALARAGEDDLVLVTGSLFVAGEAITSRPEWSP